MFQSGPNATGSTSVETFFAEKMDQTALFRACVKAVKVRNKYLMVNAKQNKARATKDECAVTRDAKQLVHFINQLMNELLRTRKQYSKSCFICSYGVYEDFDSESFESFMEQAIKQANYAIRRLKETAEQSISSPQLYRHKLAVVQIVDAYLKRLCKSYGEQKAIRVKKVADMKRMSRLSQLLRDVGGFKRLNDGEKPETVTNDSESTAEVRDTNKGDSILRRRRPQDLVSATSSKKERSTSTASRIPFENSYPLVGEQPVDEQVGSDSDQLAPELRAQLAKENDQLYEQFNTMVDEIQVLEGKVVEIARLQEVFTEKVLEQDGQIVHINETAIRTTENVKFGNEQIREAMKRGAGMRVYVLFFLLVLTFTLWFLDWYND